MHTPRQLLVSSVSTTCVTLIHIGHCGCGLQGALQARGIQITSMDFDQFSEFDQYFSQFDQSVTDGSSDRNLAYADEDRVDSDGTRARKSQIQNTSAVFILGEAHSLAGLDFDHIRMVKNWCNKSCNGRCNCKISVAVEGTGSVPPSVAREVDALFVGWTSDSVPWKDNGGNFDENWRQISRDGWSNNVHVLGTLKTCVRRQVCACMYVCMYACMYICM